MTSISQRGFRSLLFVPGDRAPELLPKALAAGADGVILDLEDGVAPSAKDAARRTIGAALPSSTDTPVFVRLNGPGSPWIAEDLNASWLPMVDGIVLPKSEGATDVRRVTEALGETMPIIALIESAAGVLAAVEIAALVGVIGLAFGAEDFAADVGARRSAGGDEVLYARSHVVLAAAAAGAWAVDSPTLDLRDERVARLDAKRARGLGFVGKLLVHPAQVAPVHAGFRPSRSEVSAARAVVRASAEAAERGSGVAEHRGRMIDAPVLAQARRVIVAEEME